MKISLLFSLLPLLSAVQRTDGASARQAAGGRAGPRRLLRAAEQKKRQERRWLMPQQTFQRRREQPVETSLKASDDELIPLLLRPLVHLYRSVPALVRVPGANLDISFTIASAIFFTCFDYTSAFILRRASGWPFKGSRLIAGSLTTIFHSIVLLTGLGGCLLTVESYKPSGLMDDHPAWWRDSATALLQLCTGYMLYDTAVQFLADRWVPGTGGFAFSGADRLFLLHHAVTTLYMTSARLIRAGHLSAMTLMFLGELTAPIMNAVRISQTATTHGMASNFWQTNAHPILEFAYALLYLIFRAFLGPVVAVHLSYDLLTKEGRKNVPVQLSILWLVMCWGVLLGSIPWIKNALRILSDAGGPIA